MAGSENVNLDLKGLKCPLPVLRTRKMIATLPVGSTMLVETTDPLAVIDIPHFCSQDGHDLIESQAAGTAHRFLIRKGK